MSDYISIGEEPKLISVNTKETIFSDTCTPLEITHELIKSLAPANCFVYWQSAELVDFGFFNGEKIILNAHEIHFELLQEARVFNEAFELHIWKRLGDFQYRIRHHESATQENNLGNCLLHKVKLWGTQAKPHGIFTIITENRGMRLSLPIQFKDEYKSGINVFLEERRYIEEDELGCIYFIDRRFSGFYVAIDNKLTKVEVNVDG